MKDIWKSWKLLLASGVLCLLMLVFSSLSVRWTSASAVLWFLFEFLILFFLTALLLGALVRIFRSFDSFAAFLAFFTAGLLWAPAIASPFLGMDTLTVFRLENPFLVFAAEGRPVTGLWTTLLKDFGWFSPGYLSIYMTLGVLALAIGMTFLWDSCLRQTRFTSPSDKILLGAAIAFLFFTPLMVVVQAFPILLLPWFLGLTALIIAVVLLMNGKSRGTWLSAFLLVCLCTNIYQTFVGYFIPLALVCAAYAHGVYDEQGRFRRAEFIRFFAGLCLIVIVSLGCSFFCAKVLSPLLGSVNVRAAGSIDIPGNLRVLLRSLKPVYFDLFGVFFPGFLPLAVAFFAGVIVSCNRWKIQRFHLLFLLLLSLAMLFCTSILLQLFVSEVWINDRSAIPCSASAGLAAFTVLFFFRGDALPPGFRKTAALLFFALMAATLHTNVGITVRMHESEVSDYYKACEFLRKVENHERNNNVSVKTVELHFRPRFSARNRPGNGPSGKIAENLEQDTKLFCTPWKIPPYFEHYFNRRFTVKRHPVQAPDTIRLWGKDKNRDDAAYDEHVFEGNTVHLINF
ncbi:MAG: hypothetical protein BWY31_04491 [Lentisphaerae bacterium ADurb.Bin242]|nr:MAG: hypothetical protein BWY31_04491 [Lentisphaerae bacterium ADurb.Bin242]